MICEKCGKNIPELSKYCPECGSSIFAADNIEKASIGENINKTKTNKAVCKIIVHIAFTILAIFLWGFICRHIFLPIILFLIGVFIILIISYSRTNSQISKRKERKKDKEAYRKNHPIENGFRIARNIIIPILLVGFIGYGLYCALNNFLKENNLEISSKINSAGGTRLLVRTLYDDDFYVSAQSHVPIYFSTSGGKVYIKATSDRKVEFITMPKYDYENRVSLLLGDYRYYPKLSTKSISLDSEDYLPAGEYVFVAQCVGLHIHTRNVHVTIKEEILR